MAENSIQTSNSSALNHSPSLLEQQVTKLLSELKSLEVQVIDKKINVIKSKNPQLLNASQASDAVMSKADALLAARMAALGVGLSSATTIVSPAQLEINQLEEEKKSRILKCQESELKVKQLLDRIHSKTNGQFSHGNASGVYETLWKPSVEDQIRFEEGIGIKTNQVSEVIKEMQTLSKSIVKSLNVQSSTQLGKYQTTNTIQTPASHTINSFDNSFLKKSPTLVQPNQGDEPFDPIQDVIRKAQEAIKASESQFRRASTEHKSSLPIPPIPEKIQNIEKTEKKLETSFDDSKDEQESFQEKLKHFKEQLPKEEPVKHVKNKSMSNPFASSIETSLNNQKSGQFEPLNSVEKVEKEEKSVKEDVERKIQENGNKGNPFLASKVSETQSSIPFKPIVSSLEEKSLPLQPIFSSSPPPAPPSTVPPPAPPPPVFFSALPHAPSPLPPHAPLLFHHILPFSFITCSTSPSSST